MPVETGRLIETVYRKSWHTAGILLSGQVFPLVVPGICAIFRNRFRTGCEQSPALGRVLPCLNPFLLWSWKVENLFDLAPDVRKLRKGFFRVVRPRLRKISEKLVKGLAALKERLRVVPQPTLPFRPIEYGV